ncbi:MAG: glycosyltransferase family 2 protein [Lachnospiraceae bacterium]|nr:glycosyltransferase family 2 protein [Lachnospiraceae bacterium]
MKEKQFPYDWASYYRAAYEKEKKNNMCLAGKIADAEAKEVDLRFRLERIQGNVFWKLTAPARKCYHALKGNKPVQHGSSRLAKEGKRADKDAEEAGIQEETVVYAYHQELFRQKHPYLQWIAEREKTDINNNSYITGEMQEKRFVEGWHRVDLEDSDLSILTCGRGIIDRDAEIKIKSWFNLNNDCIFAYTDEDYYWEDLSNRMHPWLKPCWSPDTLLSFCYVGHLIITKQSLLNELLTKGQGIPENDTSVSFYDLCLRLEERAESVGHIEEVLFHNCYEPDESGKIRIAEARQSGEDVLEVVEELLQKELEQGFHMTGCGPGFCHIREEALRRRGIRAHLEAGPDPDIYHVVYETGNRSSESDKGDGAKSDMVSVIIPSKDHPEILEKCLSSFREKTEYTNYEWIVVDNGSDPENKNRIESLQKEYGFVYLYEPMEFNFSAMCNLGARKAKGDFLLFLNDDIEIFQKDWLRVMAGQAAQPHVGAVGAKLWYADSDTIQHAGITNLRVGPSHKLTTFPDDRNYYYGRNLVTYDVIGVTAACLLIEKQKYLEAGGMEESIKVSYNDVDLCFKLIEAGYYNVLRNDAVLYHAESLSRGPDEENEDKWNRLLSEKEALYLRHPKLEGTDPFYHKDLIGDDLNYICNFKPAYADREETAALSTEDAKKTAKAKQGFLELTVDRVEKQRKLSLSEPDRMVITGWSYLPGENNAEYTRCILLQRENGILYKAELFPCLRRDVEKLLTEEVNVSLAGFVLRFDTRSLLSGTWKIGMLAEHENGRQSYLTWSDRRIEIE